MLAPEEQLAATDLSKLSAESLVETTDVVSLSAEAKSERNNLMAGNFAGAHEQSSYVKAKISGMQNAEQLKNSFNGSIVSLMPDEMQVAAAKNGDRRSQQIQKTQDGMASGESAMRDIQANINRQGAEAAAPKDENGEVIEEAVTTAAPSPQAAQAAYQAAEAVAAAAPAAAPAPAAPGTGSSSSGESRKITVNVSV